MSALSNAKWVSLSQMGKVLTQLMSMLVLARLIPPSEFGLMAMAYVVINFSLLIRDLGTSAAIIQHRDLKNSTINAIFGLNITMGTIIAIAIVILSPLISQLFKEPRLVEVLLLLSISFPIASSGSTHLALLERNSKFMTTSLIELSAGLISLIVAIVLAYLGAGVYSLVISNLLTAIISTALLWIKSNWRPEISKIFNKNELRLIFSFSSNLTIFNFINYLSRNSDSMLIGRYMSANILGSYSLAYRIMLFPLQNLTFIASRSLFPIMSRQQDNEAEVKKLFLKSIDVITFLVFPLMVGLITLREPFFYIAFGPEWALSATIILWLAPTGIIQSLTSSTGAVLMSKGRSGILLMLGVLGSTLMLTAFIIGVQYDIITLTMLYFVASVINFIPAMSITMKLLGGNIFEVITRLIGPAVCSGIMFAALYWLLYYSNLGIVVDSVFSLIYVSLFGAAIYLLSSMVFLRDRISHFKKVILKKV
ncbi:lipopolysaccharide biosynthesis protein [Serratia liquefaciens]|uniref:lipopolysaccharide biosynthesis protein n=1 Tax=Serratia liquefaciens TaxID=614 RepID=UPI0011F2B203|nr:lipopolysaccharide biosynthesis protein [Serratia liquefaciens]QIC86277.1 lipopolysaccharide biosynthesis protein [Serratia liquefaciens]